MYVLLASRSLLAGLFFASLLVAGLSVCLSVCCSLVPAYFFLVACGFLVACFLVACLFLVSVPCFLVSGCVGRFVANFLACLGIECFLMSLSLAGIFSLQSSGVKFFVSQCSYCLCRACLFFFSVLTPANKARRRAATE